MCQITSWFLTFQGIRQSMRTQMDEKHNSISINLFDKLETLVFQKFLHPSNGHLLHTVSARASRAHSIGTNGSPCQPRFRHLHNARRLHSIFEEVNKPGQREQALPSRGPQESSEFRAKHQGRGRRGEGEVQTDTIWTGASETDTLKDGGPRTGPESTSREPHRRHKSLPLANDI